MFVEDLPFSGQTKEFTYTLRCWFVTRVEAPTDRGSDLLYSEYATAKSSMVQCALDLVSYWVQDTNYSSLEIDKNFNIETFIDKTKDRDTGCYIDLRFRDVFNYDSCIIPMDGVTPPPSSECSPVTVTLNGVTPLTNAESGSNRNLEFFDEEDNVVTPIIDTDSATNTVFIFNDVPMTFNGTATAGALVGGSKSIIVQDTDGTQVGTVINDEQLNLTIQVTKGLINDVYYNRPYLTQITSYNIYDEAWRRLNSGNAYNLAIPQNAPIQSVQYDFTNGRYDYLRYVNSFGHKFRFTGENGGYYDEADGNYYDVNGNLSSLAVEFPIISFGAWWIYDHLTGYRFASKRLGARTWAVAMNDVATWVFDGETNWFNPSSDEWSQLSTFGYDSLNIFVGNTIRPFFSFDQSQHWSSTTKEDMTTSAWIYRADEGGRILEATKSTSGANRNHWSVFDNGFVTQP